MSSKYMRNSNLTGLSQNLRKNMTPEERHIWYDFLKDYPINISRQKIIGNYIADFYCAKAKLSIEIDGIQHNTDDGIYNDTIRTENIEKLGIKVIRIPNKLINIEFNTICQYIDDTIKTILNNSIP